jgi:hypothetical protein
MATDKEFKCSRCDKRIQVSEGADVPHCCELDMVAAEPLDQCTLASTPEHSRFDDTDEPCDDGRAG